MYGAGAKPGRLKSDAPTNLMVDVVVVGVVRARQLERVPGELVSTVVVYRLEC